MPPSPTQTCSTPASLDSAELERSVPLWFQHAFPVDFISTYPPSIQSVEAISEVRSEVLFKIPGVHFATCYASRRR